MTKVQLRELHVMFTLASWMEPATFRSEGTIDTRLLRQYFFKSFIVYETNVLESWSHVSLDITSNGPNGLRQITWAVSGHYNSVGHLPRLLEALRLWSNTRHNVRERLQFCALLIWGTRLLKCLTSPASRQAWNIFYGNRYGW